MSLTFIVLLNVKEYSFGLDENYQQDFVWHVEHKKWSEMPASPYIAELSYPLLRFS
jgi:hypothetical protein